MAAGWPLAFGLTLLSVETLRGRTDLRLVGTVVILSLLLSSLGAIVFDVGSTLRRLASLGWQAQLSALTADFALFGTSLLVIGLTPWNTLPALALGAFALIAAFAHLALIARQGRWKHALALASAILVLALCGSAAIAGTSLVAIWRAGPEVLSLDLPKSPPQ